MADPDSIAVNAGEQASTTATTLRLSPEDQFRLINQRLDTLSAKVDQIAAPPAVRLVDGLQLLVIVIGLLLAGFTALGFSERMADLSSQLAESERRVTAAMSAMELRLQARIEKLSDQSLSLTERTSRLEGARSAEKPDAKPQAR